MELIYYEIIVVTYESDDHIELLDKIVKKYGTVLSTVPDHGQCRHRAKRHSMRSNSAGCEKATVESLHSTLNDALES
jgi:hypothetical protein